MIIISHYLISPVPLPMKWQSYTERIAPMLRIVSHSTAQALLAFLAISAQGALPQPRVDRIKANL